MSLPAAPKQTTEKPAAGAVMEPVNKDEQAADIDRKVSLPEHFTILFCPRFQLCPAPILRRHSSLP